MKIYVISKHDMDSSHVHSAYVDKFTAVSKVAQLNADELIKEQKYNDWVVNSDDEDETCPPEYGDYVFLYNEIELFEGTPQTKQHIEEIIA